MCSAEREEVGMAEAVTLKVLEVIEVWDDNEGRYTGRFILTVQDEGGEVEELDWPEGTPLPDPGDVIEVPTEHLR